MEFTVTVKIEAAPVLLEALAALVKPQFPAFVPKDDSKPIKAITETTEAAPVKKAKSVSTPEPKEASAPAPEKAEDKLTLEHVRGQLAALSRAGKQPAVKKLIESFGVSKLTDIPEDQYAELLAQAEAL